MPASAAIWARGIPLDSADAFRALATGPRPILTVHGLPGDAEPFGNVLPGPPQLPCAFDLVLAVETFTDPARHTGACYAAANFRQVGGTLGYCRSAGSYRHHGSPKRVWIRPLYRSAFPVLSALFDHPLLTREEPRVIDLNALPLAGDRASLLEVLGGLTDPRARRGIRHKAAATLTMVTAAGLSGCGRSFRSAADFIADLPQEALARLGARYHPAKRRYIAPEESTIRRHVKMIDADQADRLAPHRLLRQPPLDAAVAGEARAALGQGQRLIQVGGVDQ
jgi:hypothetical protein